MDTTNIAAIMTCHNRKDKTLNCLKTLFQASLPEGCYLDIHLVDDGSTDGTSEAVKHQYPQINIYHGDGNLFWTRGMHLAWQKAAAKNCYDYYLWLNDDVTLFNNFLVDLLDVNKKYPDSIVCGVTRSEKNEKATYGGRDSKGKLLIPNGQPQLFDGVFNGNIVLISKYIYQKAGNLDPLFKHAIGDYDYAMRAKSKDILAYVTPNYSGICEEHESLPKWCLPEIPLRIRVKSLYSPLGNAQPKYFFLFEKRHFGIAVASKHLLSIHLRLLFPKLWRQ
ncbi:MAG: glycosyltransferase family 2 protein [Bacteroidales bacterium]|nr:glycosyltransferase family 2 protein [Bacteroidales bacterium]